jgi:hypothetical protein
MTMPNVAESRQMRFAVKSWAAVAAGLSTQSQWLGWFREPTPVERDFTPDLSSMPAALRRRVSPLGRAALSVLMACQADDPCPVVFASRYGDLEAIAQLLTQLHQEGLVSPMGFSLSVHNAAMGIHSIAGQDRTPTVSIAAKTDLAESAFFEALGWLALGTGDVQVVCCEDAVPPPYRAEPGAPNFRYAWACRLSADPLGPFALMMAQAQSQVAPGFRVTPPSLRALAFLVGDEVSALSSESGRYLWRRHAPQH